MVELKKPIPIGIENYKEMIEKGYYYVDKTLLVKELLDSGSKVSLITRPRRFGKTLGLSTIQTFFECAYDWDGNPVDNRHCFAGKKIMDAGERYTSEMGRYPVIKLTLKSAKQPNFEMAYGALRGVILGEFTRHRYILESDRLTQGQRERFDKIMNEEAEQIDYAKAVEFLSECLECCHGQKAIILFDEYDVPLENAYFEGFYSEMVSFIRSLFESALKTNDHLAFAVVTGCLRISRESIFTGMNNLRVISVLNNTFAEYFGLMPREVEEMLDFYGIAEKKEEVQNWYDGYLFGQTEVYNLWSVINYVAGRVSDGREYPVPYWSNTSSNSIIRELVEAADTEVRGEIEGLIEGGTIEKPIHEDITYDSIHQSQDNLWNFLFFTGYLKAVSQRFDGETTYLTMCIPNAEVRYVYRNTILEWFEQKVKATDMSRLYEAVKSGDAAAFEEIVSEQLADTISFFDYAENYYHGFLTGLLRGCPGYAVKSNRESGNGRPDLIMRTPSVRGMAIVMEIKIVKSFDEMEEGCDEALEQIERQDYTADLYREGFRRFRKYGICFYRKECMVRGGQEEQRG